MKQFVTELAAVWRQLPAALDTVFRETSPGLDRATRLAELLRALAPAGLAACRLTQQGRSDLAWSSEAVPKASKLEERLRKALDRADPSAEDILCLSEMESRFSGQTFVAAVTHGGQSRGFLLLVQPPETPAAQIALAETLLLDGARMLALELRLEEETTRRTELLEQVAGPSGLELIGEATIGIAHAIGNHLNTILLQTTIVQMQSEAERKNGLDLIRQKCRQMQMLLQPLQSSWEQQKKSVVPIDLNKAATEARAAEPDRPSRIRLELASEKPMVSATPAGLVRMLRLLLKTALLRQPPTAGPVILRTSIAGGKAHFAVEDSGSQPPDLQQTDLFHLEDGVFAAVSPLEQQALQSLLRLFNATLTASARSGGGLVLTVEWS
jgi:hypothetical protein